MSTETSQAIADPLRMVLMVLAVIVFAVIVAWTCLRQREQIRDVDAQLWNNDEKVGSFCRKGPSGGTRSRSGQGPPDATI